MPRAIRTLATVLLSLTLCFAARAETSARTTSARPLALTLESGLGGWAGLFGYGVGYHVTDRLELAAAGGLGLTGAQAALTVRWAQPAGRSRTASWIFSLGPSLAFRSEALGARIERATAATVIDPERLFYTTWLNAEVGWQVRARWGGLLRLTAGAGLRLADNQRGLCDGAPADEPGDCAPRGLGPGSRFARHPVLPSLNLAFGWAF